MIKGPIQAPVLPLPTPAPNSQSVYRLFSQQIFWLVTLGKAQVWRPFSCFGFRVLELRILAHCLTFMVYCDNKVVIMWLVILYWDLYFLKLSQVTLDISQLLHPLVWCLDPVIVNIIKWPLSLVTTTITMLQTGHTAPTNSFVPVKITMVTWVPDIGSRAGLYYLKSMLLMTTDDDHCIG